MTSPEWPVYQVFERPAVERPMRAGGSVHAVDADMALQSAWAVYGRRPTAVALWVVPRCLVLMKTREELAGFSPSASAGAACAQPYCVFRRCGSKLVYEEATPVHAANDELALARAFSQSEDCVALWVFPATAITSSETAPVEGSFTLQPQKWFRDHKSFPVNAMLREIRADVTGAGNA
jgi:ring-1,2-phenylacetyl-CoA epoxidase subunit PaaB